MRLFVALRTHAVRALSVAWEEELPQFFTTPSMPLFALTTALPKAVSCLLTSDLYVPDEAEITLFVSLRTVAYSLSSAALPAPESSASCAISPSAFAVEAAALTLCAATAA